MESGEQVLVNVSSIREIRQNSVIDMNNNPIEIRKKASPKRAVNVRSPVKYTNGSFKMPQSVSIPMTQGKLSSSFDVIEGDPNRNYTQT